MSTPVLRVGEREVHELQGALERGLGDRRVAVPPLPRPADLAPHIAELRGEGELPPSAGGEARMPDVRHRATSSFTSVAICSRVPGSSTPRVRFPNDGRRLIMESYSSQSDSGRSG